MATQQKTQNHMADTALLWLAIVVLCASIFGYYWFASAMDVLRVLGMLAGAVVAVFIALQTAVGKTAWAYIKGSKAEMRRVTWPNRRETIQTTMMVIVVVLLLSMSIWVMDIFLGWFVQLVAHR